ncbi:RNA polymerase sigma factor [Kribbella sindirgiensis]|uniref:Sigma-70 family RNA polymerase sigma factor n=1 Tax=Kribbella sindirgiensis TaxID=1124744 RepID=A0A4V2M487_9ACTN|nr:sigma-70 family RNA polymerase sigma factor [Kribbella sindirgiensis]TCC34962.1 sigma-70 family RNA polymerase sigma factor [Kribbella sindirgiensis]
MQSGEADELGKQPAAAAPLQPDVGVGLEPHWKKAAATFKEADHVDRLQADYELVVELGWLNFEGPEYDYFQSELVKYAMAVLTSWIRKRTIFHYCRQRGHGGLPPAPAGAFEDPGYVEDLVVETVGKALVKFRDYVLVGGRWDYRRGASLRTYFVGQCLIQFANVYNSWRRHDADRVQAVAVAEPREFLQRHDPSPEELVVQQEYVAGFLRGMKPRDRQIFTMIGQGLTHLQIAQELGVTVKAIERAVANQRDRLRKEREA